MMMIHKIAMVLVLIGGLNWGLVGITSLFGNAFDLVDYIMISLIGLPVLAHITYLLVGISALILAFGGGMMMNCDGMGMKMGMGKDMGMRKGGMQNQKGSMG